MCQRNNRHDGGRIKKMFEKFYFDLLSLKTEMQFRGYSISTQKTYYKTVKEFLEITGKEVINIKRDDIIRYLDNNLKFLDVNTVLVKLNALEFFFTEILGIDIAENIRKYKRKFKTKEFLTMEQLNILISSVPARERLIYKIVIETGMIVDEVVDLTVKDLILKNNTWELKGYKITKELATEITDYTEKNYLEHYIFTLLKRDEKELPQTARYWLRRHTKEVLGQVYSFNDIRHSIALEMIKKGDEKGAVEYLGIKTVFSLRQFYKRAGYDYYKEK